MVTTTPLPAVPADRETRRPDGGRLDVLDAVRFLAAIAVVLYHFAGRSLDVWRADTADLFGGLGEVLAYVRIAPELFFVVSGFAILWTAWGRSVPQVVASRLARVYPAFWAALALTVVLFVVVWPSGKDVTAAQVAANATLLHEPLGQAPVDGVYWTLWTELRFYLIMTVFVAVGITRARVLLVAAVWPVAALLADELTTGLLPELLIGRFAPYFAGGMALFLVYRDGHARLPWLVVLGNTALAVLTSVAPLADGIRQHTSHEPVPWLIAVTVVGCFAVVALAALSPLRRVRWPFLATLGALTYPVYLVHQMWGRWVIASLRDTTPPGVTLAAAVAVAVLLALVVHHAVERRVNRPARRWLEARLAGAATALRRAWATSPTPETQAPRRARGAVPGQPVGIPPTGPGGREPSRIPAQKAGDASGSRSTVEPTPPGW